MKKLAIILLTAALSTQANAGDNLGPLDRMLQRIDQASCALGKKQKIYDKRQVKKASELKVGKTYIWVHKNPCSDFRLEQVLEITEINKKKGKFKAIWHSGNNFKFEDNFSMEDYGLKPYSTGFWNLSNYLLPKE